MKYLKIFWIFILCIPIIIQAEDEIWNAFQIQPEVTHQYQPEYGQVDSKGDLNLQIPIMTVPGRGGLDYQIVFQYHSGITVDQHATWLGLGWSFDPGSITRDVKGSVIIGNEPMGVDFPYKHDPLQSNLEDYAHDVYYLHIDNRTIPFFEKYMPSLIDDLYPINDYFYTVPWRPWKIDPIGVDEIVVEGDSTQKVKSPGVYIPVEDYEGFIVMKENGIRYVYEMPTLAYYINIAAGYYAPPLPNLENHFVSTWRLRAILGTDYSSENLIPGLYESGSWIRFDYDYLGIDGQVKSVADPSPSATRTLTQLTYLYKIFTPTHEATIITSDRDDRDACDYRYVCIHKKMERIELRHRDEGGLAIENDPYEVVQLGFGDIGDDKKILLNSINIYDENEQNSSKYTFNYWLQEDGINFLDPYYAVDIGIVDDFGYLNTNVFGTVRDNPNGDKKSAKAWSLKQIVYPTGGSETFYYENDSIQTGSYAFKHYIHSSGIEQDKVYVINSNNNLQGGIRVKKIERSDGINSPSEYCYKYSIGKLTAVPYHYLYYALNTRKALHNSGARNHATVYYDTVSTYNPDGSYEVSEYRTDERCNVLCFSVYPATYFSVLQDNSDWNWGELLSSKYYQNDDDIVKKIENTYTSNSFLHRILSDNWTESSSYKIYHYTGLQLLNSEYISDYDPNLSSTYVDRLTQYTYLNSAFVKTKTESGVLPYPITEYTYAHEIAEYSDMKDQMNMLSQIAQETVSDNSGNDRSSIVTTWKNDWSVDYNGWEPHKIYQWKENDGEGVYNLPGFSFTYWSVDVEPTEPEWLRVLKIHDRDEHGNILKTEDAVATLTHTQWGYNEALPEMNIVNASDGDFGFQNLEKGWQDWEQGGSGITDDLAFTGTHSAHCNETYGPTKNFLVSEGVDKNKTYIADGWIKRISGEAKIALSVRNSTNDVLFSKTKIINTGDKWQYICVEVTSEEMDDLEGISYIRLFCGFPYSGNEGYVDDVRFYPQNALMTTNTYNPKTFQVASSSDGNNVPSFTRYDGFGRPMETLNAQKNLINHVSYYYSRNGNGDVFNPGDPNYVKSMSISEELFREDFEYEDSPLNHDWVIFDGSGTINTSYDNVLSSRILHKEGGLFFGIEYPGARNLDEDSPHLWVKVKSDDLFFFIVRIRATDQTEYFLRYEPNDGTPAVNGEFVYHYLGTEYQDGYWHSFNRDLRKDLELTGKSFECVRWFRIYSDCEIDDIRLTDVPTTQVVYTDGLGREIQTQTWDGDGDILVEKDYNQMGKVMRQLKPKRFTTGTLHNYRTSVSGDWELYSYYNEPMTRLYRVTHPYGSSYIEYAYGVATFDGNLHQYTQIKDEEYTISKQYFDVFGNKRGGKSAVNTDDEILWTQEYDIFGNVGKNKPPNFYEPPSGNSNDYESDYTYNTLGQMVKKETPDEETSKYVYDNAGNLRYSQNAQQATSEGSYNFTVYYYDKQNRITLTGEEKDDFNWQGTQPSINNTTYGQEANEWRIKYYYDQNFVTDVDNYCQGRLTMTEINEDEDAEPEHVTKYVYDMFGNVKEKWITIDQDDASAEANVVRHEYDLLGREVAMSYPSGHSLNRIYNEVGQLEKIVSPEYVFSNVLVEVKVFLEGPYNQSTGQMRTDLNTGGYIPKTSPYTEDPRTVESIPSDVVDWVLVQLRQIPDGQALTSRSAFLRKDGCIVADDGTTPKIRMKAVDRNYYIVIDHRNHLAVMSANFVTLNGSSSVCYDFTTSDSQFYKDWGISQIDSNVWGMITGDTDNSGSVGASDRNRTWNDRTKIGYYDTDCDMSTTVGASDRNITWNKRTKITHVP